MAYVLVNKDGTSNAKPGDTVVHGGGMTTINKDGTKTTVPLPGIGSTKNYNTVVDVMNKITKDNSSWATGVSSRSSSSASNVVKNPVEVFESPTNYDDFTSGFNFSYDPMSAVNSSTPNYSGGSMNLSKVVGYGIVGLVLIAVLDKLIG